MRRRRFHHAVSSPPSPPSLPSSSSSGLLSWLAGDSHSPFPSLSEPLHELHLPAHLLSSSQDPTTKLTKLKNGVRVASENSPRPTSIVGIYIDSGSIHGASRSLEWMAFKSTVHRTHFRLVREVEAKGMNFGFKSWG